MTLHWREFISGDGLRARALRGSGFTVVNFALQNLFRLGSNLILTRLLFPEAFGLMALVNVVILGLQMVSDAGLHLSVIQNRRGDEEDFLNTAWTLSIARGTLLWLLAVLLAWPAATLYDEPMLLQLLPVVGAGAFLHGWMSPKVHQASRHMRLGRVTALTIGSQLFSIAVMITLAWLLGSVWALAMGTIAGSAMLALLSHIALPGPRNRIRWEPSAVRELLGFGVYIFLSSLAGFVIAQGDRAILGAFVSVETLGVYGIGYALGVMPQLLCATAARKVVFPLYSRRPPTESAGNRRNLRRVRWLLTAGSLSAAAVFAWSGLWLVELLYDDRYLMAGAVVSAFAAATVPTIVFQVYPESLLAAGQSQRFLILTVVNALLQTAFMFLMIERIGILGAISAQAAAVLIIHPLTVYFIRPRGVWDPLHDVVFLVLGLLLTGSAVWVYWEAISVLMAI